MNNIADDLTYALVCDICQPGGTFHSRALKALMVISYVQLHQELHRLQKLGVIRFTGQVCLWQRIR